jgi:hypothetical protein
MIQHPSISTANAVTQTGVPVSGGKAQLGCWGSLADFKLAAAGMVPLLCKLSSLSFTLATWQTATVRTWTSVVVIGLATYSEPTCKATCPVIPLLYWNGC